jgi:hypothetical protein
MKLPKYFKIAFDNRKLWYGHYEPDADTFKHYAHYFLDQFMRPW